MSDTATVTVGLRWSKLDLGELQAARDLQRVIGASSRVGLFDKAIAATEAGQPMPVICSSVEEARRIAYDFVRANCPLPTVEEIRGR